MREKDATRKYFVEFSSTLLIYFLLLFGSSRAVAHVGEGLGRTLVLLSPMIGVLLVIWAVVRHMRRVDEFVRLKVLEHLALSSGVTIGFAFSYGFLENAGFPRLSMFTVWFVFGGSWAFISCGQLLYSKLFAK
jgi:hypothetical protein